MQVIVLPLTYRCRQRLSRWLYQRWPALAGKGRAALSPAEPLPARKAKILLAVLYLLLYMSLYLSISISISISLYVRVCVFFLTYLKYLKHIYGLFTLFIIECRLTIIWINADLISCGPLGTSVQLESTYDHTFGRIVCKISTSTGHTLLIWINLNAGMNE